MSKNKITSKDMYSTRIHISEAKKHLDKEIYLSGWVDTKRDHGKVTFIDLRDRSGLIQCVGVGMMGELTVESVVKLKGKIKKRPEKMVNKDVVNGDLEMEVLEYEVLSKAEELPIPIKTEYSGDEAEISKRLDNRWIDLRREEKRRIFEVWTTLEKGVREYIYNDGYIQMYPPAFMDTPSESGSEVFEVKYFDGKAFLAQSPQFYKQLAMAAGVEKVFMVGPVFRAEPSFTTRHMTEFTGWDFEVSFVESHYDAMHENEKMLAAGFKALKEDLGMDIDVPTIPFPKLTMKEAKEKLEKAGIKGEKEFDINPTEERELCRMIKEETGHDFLFIVDWPIEGRPFYHMRYEDNPKITKSFDLLFKGIEIVTGAQREHRVEYLIKQAKEKGMDLDSIQGYISFFKYGCPPHGGGGIGPARIIMRLLDLPSVKEATFLPRDVKRITP